MSFGPITGAWEERSGDPLIFKLSPLHLQKKSRRFVLGEQGSPFPTFAAGVRHTCTFQSVRREASLKQVSPLKKTATLLMTQNINKS